MKARISVTWMVGGKDKITRRILPILNNTNIYRMKKEIIKLLTHRKVSCEHSDAPNGQDHRLGSFLLKPGDLCTLLLGRSSENDSRSVSVVLFHSFWRYSIGIKSRGILWFRVHNSLGTVSVSTTQTVTQVKASQIDTSIGSMTHLGDHPGSCRDVELEKSSQRMLKYELPYFFIALSSTKAI